MDVRTAAARPVLVAFAMSACSDPPTRSPGVAVRGAPSASALALGGGIPIPVTPELLGDVPEVRLNTPPSEVMAELGDADLVTTVRGAGGRVYIGFKPPGAQYTRVSGVLPAMTRASALSAREEVLARGARLLRTFPRSATIVAEIPAELAPAFRRLPIVNYVEPVPEMRVASQDTSWGVKKVGAPTIWNTYSNRGEYATISFLDSGMDWTHFGAELPATADCYYDPFFFTTCFDDLGHGSHVIGIAAAQSNAAGMIGVSHVLARLASFKVCDWTRACYEDAQVQALSWLEVNGNWPRHIISMSLGGPNVSTEYRAVVTRLYNRGDLLIAAAGNNPNQWNFTGVMEPARLPEVIAVSGTLEGDGFASGYLCQTARGSWVISSNSGPDVHLSAPFHARSTYLGGTYDIDCGTSMATPVVSATAALVWTQNTSWTNIQVHNRLFQTAVDLGAPGRDAQFGYGRVNAAAAAAPLPPPPTVSIVGPSKVRPNASCIWQASASGGTPPYTYMWWRNGGYLSSQSQVTTSFASSGTLFLEVRDAVGSVNTASKNVTVSASAPICQF